MFKLIGYDYDHCGYWAHDDIATFDSEVGAWEYILDSGGESVGANSWRGPFHPMSLLFGSQNAKVEKYEKIPHNPKKNWN
jgi:hypothetical protein